MENIEVDKAKAFNNVGLIEYVTGSIVIKTIIKRTTGSISVVSFDTGKIMADKPIPFDTFIQIIEGEGEFVIDGLSNFLDTGQSIILPAHTSNIIKARARFKMISTIIKSGYE